MSQVIPLLVLAVLVAGLFVFTRRSRQRATADDARRRATIRPGTAVMTTSGLYATVTRIDDDDTVALAIAPGVEVRWALAALRDMDSLPAQYQPVTAHPLTDESAEERTDR